MSDDALHELRQCIQNTPIIDHHAHNLLLPTEQECRPLLSITTEAGGDALPDASSTLAHMRAVKQLARVLECEATWEAVQQHLHKKRIEDDELWAKFCFQGIETVLIDDGLDKNTVHPYHWHNRLIHSPCKRIVRIEMVAERLLMDAVKDFHDQHKALDVVQDVVWQRFRAEILSAINDREVVGFKSVICYRTGLAIPIVAPDEAIHACMELLCSTECTERSRRLQDTNLSPFFVNLTAILLTQEGSRKPFQFHTGLGDSDIRLPYSSPSHMQPFIERFPSVSIVLLHASYPFTREAGYLASVYRNVYLDIGEVFPMVSQDGQESVVRQALELCPSEKLTWSTDGHWFPETYLLATMQIREGLEKMMCEYVKSQNLTVAQATKVVQDILFNTSNRIYSLNLALETFQPTVTKAHERPSAPQATTPIEGLDKLHHLIATEPSLRFLRLQWVDFTATVRLKVLTLKHAIHLFSQGKGISITKAALSLVQSDSLVDNVPPVGQLEVYPIFSSLRLAARPGYAMVQCEFRDDDGVPVEICPRTFLRKQVEMAQSESVCFLVGFEIEVVFLHAGPNDKVSGSDEPQMTPGHCWSSSRALHDSKMMDLLEAIVAALERSGISIQQFHAESGPGQYEFVMDPMEPLAAVDALICAKDTIMTIASKYGMRATMVPKVSPTAPSTGAHAHISVKPVEKHQHFLAGILRELRAIMAITCPNPASYERVVDSVWSGGTWVAWGTENRETPIRLINGNSGPRYEIKCMDGFANPYLALGVILGRGAYGIKRQLPLEDEDCPLDPGKMDTEERRGWNIKYQLPRTFEEALNYLDSSNLQITMGDVLIKHYFAVKRKEMEMLSKVEDRQQWLIDRY
ncbi:MAG: hypothetical protein Q9180_005244 [Flavoplaca navasiana]